MDFTNQRTVQINGVDLSVDYAVGRDDEITVEGVFLVEKDVTEMLAPWVSAQIAEKLRDCVAEDRRGEAEDFAYDMRRAA